MKMIKEEFKQLCLSRQSGSIRTMNLHKSNVTYGEMVYYTNIENLTNIAPIFIMKRLITPIYSILHLFISHIALIIYKNEK